MTNTVKNKLHVYQIEPYFNNSMFALNKTMTLSVFFFLYITKWKLPEQISYVYFFFFWDKMNRVLSTLGNLTWYWLFMLCTYLMLWFTNSTSYVQLRNEWGHSHSSIFGLLIYNDKCFVNKVYWRLWPCIRTKQQSMAWKGKNRRSIAEGQRRQKQMA